MIAFVTALNHFPWHCEILNTDRTLRVFTYPKSNQDLFSECQQLGFTSIRYRDRVGDPFSFLMTIP